MSYEIYFTKQAQKDLKKIVSAGLNEKVKGLVEVLKKDPFEEPPHFKKLIGSLSGLYSRRINITHRLVYQVFQKESAVKIIRLWTHYDGI